MGFLQKILRRVPAPSLEPPLTVLSLLDELHQAQHRDYCLFLRPNYAANTSTDHVPFDPQALMAAAFAPLPVLPVDLTAADLPDEAFLTLAESARVLWLVPVNISAFVSKLKLLKEKGPIERCIFLMPENGAFGETDWPTSWAATRARAAAFGIELSAYTAGGWLFRLDADGKACTFRPIVNPNVEKIARALEAICEQMQ